MLRRGDGVPSEARSRDFSHNIHPRSAKHGYSITEDRHVWSPELDDVFIRGWQAPPECANSCHQVTTGSSYAMLNQRHQVWRECTTSARDNDMRKDLLTKLCLFPLQTMPSASPHLPFDGVTRSFLDVLSFILFALSLFSIYRVLLYTHYFVISSGDHPIKFRRV